MSKKPEERDTESCGLWIRPRPTLKGPQPVGAWPGERRIGARPLNRILELADVALGGKKAHKKKAAAASVHDVSAKKRPYSG